MSYKPMVLIGVLLIVLGTAALVWQQISYTERETVVDVGAINITAETKKRIPLPPILGGIALAGGVGMVILGMKSEPHA